MTSARKMSAAAAERSWLWWTNDAEHEFAGPNGKTPRLDVGVGVGGGGGGGGDDDDDGYWGDDSAAIASPLDLSMKATVTATAQRVQRAPEYGGNAHAAATPAKRKPAVRSPSKKTAAGKTAGAAAAAVGVRPSAIKAVTRRLLPQLMWDRTSPVSGTIITTMAGSTAADGCAEDDYDGDDIDPEYNIVVATDDARRRLESIPNVLGPYRCRLCGVRYADAFALARHRCRCIVHVRYRCPECDKVFQCPANLASHRRWHGTGTAGSVKTTAGGTNNNNENTTNNENANNNENTTDNENTNNNENTTDNNDDDDDASDPTVSSAVSVSAASVTTAAGFKKDMLLRAVQAAAAARIDEDGACT